MKACIHVRPHDISPNQSFSGDKCLVLLHGQKNFVQDKSKFVPEKIIFVEQKIFCPRLKSPVRSFCKTTGPNLQPSLIFFFRLFRKSEQGEEKKSKRNMTAETAKPICKIMSNRGLLRLSVPDRFYTTASTYNKVNTPQMFHSYRISNQNKVKLVA